MKKIFLSLIAVVLMVSNMSYAGDITADAKVIAKHLKDNYRDVFEKITIGKDSDGNPKISFESIDIKQKIYLYGCDDNHKNCTSIQFFAGFENSGDKSLSFINKWNRKKRFGRVYLDENNDIALEMDLDLTHPVSEPYFDEIVKTWMAVLLSFTLEIAK